MFEDIKDRIKDQIASLWNRIQESETYEKVRSKYELLPENQQLIAKIAAAVFVFFLVLVPPWTYFSSGAEKETEMDRLQKLSRDLIKTERESAVLEQIRAESGGDRDLTQTITTELGSINIPQDRIKSVTMRADLAPQSLKVTKEIKTQVVQAEIIGINLQQIADITTTLERTAYTKIINLVLTANQPDPHYYDMRVDVAQYSLPPAEAPEADTKKPRPGSKRP